MDAFEAFLLRHELGLFFGLVLLCAAVWLFEYRRRRSISEFLRRRALRKWRPPGQEYPVVDSFYPFPHAPHRRKSPGHHR